MKYFFIALLFVIFLCCPGAYSDSSMSLEEVWNSLYQKGGCLTGGQHWGPGTSEGSVFRQKEWQDFFKQSPSLSIPYLVGRIGSAKTTSIHVCPFHNATEGELAVYASEHILKINWYESGNEYPALKKWSEKKKNAMSPVTQLLLESPEAQEELKKFFLSKIN